MSGVYYLSIGCQVVTLLIFFHVPFRFHVCLFWVSPLDRKLNGLETEWERR